AYRLRPLPGWKTSWVTEITHMENGRYFVDEQRFGPYAFWHHLHRLDDVPGGVKMTDTVHYKIPFDFLGNWVNALVVKKKLDEIFAYRRRKMETLFGRL
ncbi:MAG TPA: SRPBCC family protein, partial [Chitinophagales bacterium]|nr:SRPBCC family protein [Chitinophagales bacterium]